MKNIDILEFNRQFQYSKSTGEFIRMSASGKCRIGSRVGCSRNGYLVIGFRYKYYFAHHLVWYIETGKWPKYNIDHINGNKTDNRFCNLRDVSQRVNQQNRSTHRAGKLVGASFDKLHNSWKSRINVDGKTLNLGNFATEIEAHNRYMEYINSL